MVEAQAGIITLKPGDVIRTTRIFSDGQSNEKLSKVVGVNTSELKGDYVWLRHELGSSGIPTSETIFLNSGCVDGNTATFSGRYVNPNGIIIKRVIIEEPQDVKWSYE